MTKRREKESGQLKEVEVPEKKANRGRGRQAENISRVTRGKKQRVARGREEESGREYERDREKEIESKKEVESK